MKYIVIRMRPDHADVVIASQLPQTNHITNEQGILD